MNSPEENFQKAIYCFRNGDYASAGALCNHILKETPKNPSTFHLMGIIFFKQNQLQQSYQFLSAAIRQYPENAQFQLDYAKTLGAMNNESALKHYQKAYELAPNSHQTNYALAMYYKLKDNLPKARQYFENVLK